MPRRASSKKLNISTAGKSSTDGDKDGKDNGSQAKTQEGDTKQRNASDSTLPHSSQLGASPGIVSSTDPSIPGQQIMAPNPIAGKPRQEQLQLILKHRQILLKRIQQSKKAAEKRLANPGERTIEKVLQKLTAETSSMGKPPALAADGQKLQGENIDTTTKNDNSTKSDEVQCYKELTKLAMAAARKQKADEAAAEKRTSVSLRRGASVGKRMNAAISALTPGTSTADDDTVTVVASNATATSIATATATTTSIKPPSITPSILNVPTKKLKTSSTTSSTSKTETKKRPRNPSVLKSTNVPRLAYHHPSAHHQHHHHYPLQQAPTPLQEIAPSVVYPQAMELRERRKVIRTKLDKFLQQHKLPSTAKTCASDTTTRLFPSRRKTHWDVVMEEMRWLSTDFSEERKWKAASGKVLAKAVAMKLEEDAAAATTAAAVAAAASEETNGSDGDVVMDEANIGELEDVGTSVKETPKAISYGRVYELPTPEDDESRKRIAKDISARVTEEWDAILEPRSNTIRKLGKNSDSTDKDVTDSKKASVDGDNASDTSAVQEVKQNSVIDVGTPDKPPSGVVSPEEKSASNKETDDSAIKNAGITYESIDKAVDAMANRIEKRPRQRSRAKQTAKSKHSLSPVEQKASDFIDFCWKGQLPAGAVLGNANSFSAYDVVSSLLHQNQHDGPHLVLCPPSRVLTWFVELKRSRGDESYRILLLSGMNSLGNALESLTEGDIVVGELASSLLLDGDLDAMKFESIVVDTAVAIGTHKAILGKEIRQAFDPVTLTEPWWSTLLRAAASGCSRRLLVGNSFFLYGDKHEGEALLQRLPDRERLNFLAGAAAFVFGPELFVHLNKTPTHRVLSWARQRTKRESAAGRSSLKDIETCLLSLVHNISFSPEEHFETVQQAFEEKSIFDTEVTLCKMSATQQSAYDLCCRNLRGALSLGGTMSDAARGFIQLREVCFHARLREWKEVPNSPSQPDVQWATKMLRDSSKLRELVLLLHREFGCPLEGLSCLGKAFPEFQPKSKKGGKVQKEGTKKIAILASSPVVQRLTSCVLSALGIDHDMLVKCSQPERNAVRGSGNMYQWVETQLALLRYQNVDVDNEGFPFSSRSPLVTSRSANIVLGSVKDVAQMNSGLSIETSDVLIFLDEEWSGRESALIKRAIITCFLHRARHDEERSDFRVYRLICDDCCEEKLLCGVEDNDDTVDLDEEWAVSRHGYLEFDESRTISDESFGHFDPDYVFAFPVRNLVSFENDKLASFLGTKKPLPPNLESGKELLFLPFEKAIEGKLARRELILEFGKEMVNAEDALIAEAKSTRLVSPHNVSQLAKDGTTIASMSFALSIKLYAERFGSSSLATQHDTTGAAVSLRSAVASGVRGHSFEGADETPRIKPDESSLLFYSGCSTLGATGGSVDLSMTTSRRNAFSTSYIAPQLENPTTHRFSTQGFEPMVYFPPLFPRSQQVSNQAKIDLQHLRQTHLAITNRANSGSTKRLLETTDEASLEKKAKLDGAALSSSSQPNVIEARTADQQIPNGVKTHSSVGVSHDGPGYVAQLAIVEDTNPLDRAKKNLIDIDEDFGVLGVGALPFTSSNDTVELDHYLTSFDGIITKDEMHGWCDTEEAEMNSKQALDSSLNSMILFVTRKPFPGGARSKYASSNHHSKWNSNLVSLAPSHHQLGGGLNGSMVELHGNGTKKTKKPNAFSSSALGPMPTSDFAFAQGSMASSQTKSKDAIKHRILAMFSRPGFGGSTLFESSNFRLASLRVRDRVEDRLNLSKSSSRHAYRPAHYWNGPEHWVAAVVPKGLGDETRRMLGIQYASSDFGPFQAGNMKTHSHILQSRPNLGFFLPMGVKIPSQRPHQRLPWSTDDNTKLRELAMRFSMNWRLISLNMGKGPRRRSTDHCLDQWCLLAHTDPELVNAIAQVRHDALLAGSLGNVKVQALKKYIRVSMAGATDAMDIDPVDEVFKIPYELLPQDPKRVACLVLPPAPTPITAPSPAPNEEVEIRQGSDQPQNGNTEKKKSIVAISSRNKDTRPEKSTSTADSSTTPGTAKRRRNFASLLSSASKTKVLPITIPGLVAGQTKPTVAPSHASHHQALQTAVTALSSGRTEMWPLQILDLQDKHSSRATTATTTSSTQQQQQGFQAPRHYTQPAAQQPAPAQQPTAK